LKNYHGSPPRMGSLHYGRFVFVTSAGIELLKSNCGKRVEIRCADGEVMEVAVVFVSESERDVIYDLISTNRGDRYSGRTGGEAYSTPFDDIESVRAVAE